MTLANKKNASMIYFVSLLILLLISQLDTYALSPLLPTIAQSYSLSVFDLGILVSVHAFIGVVWGYFLGPLCDRYGSHLFVNLAAALLIVSSGLIYSTTESFWLLFARLIAGLASVSISIGIYAEIASRFRVKNRGRALGGVSAIYALSAVIGAPLAVYFSHSNWKYLYLIFTLLSLVSLVSLLICDLVNATNHPENRNSPITGHKKTFQIYKGFILHKIQRLGLLLSFFVAASISSIITFIGLWLKNELLLTYSEIMLTFILLGVFSVLGSLLGGFLVSHNNKTTNIKITSVFCIISSLMLLYYSSNITLVYLFSALLGLFVALRESSYQALIAELVSISKVATYLAAKSIATRLGMGFSALICGLIFQHFEFLGVIVFACACNFSIIFISRSIERIK